MTAASLRQKIHKFIDTAKQEKLKVIYSMIENEKVTTSMLTDAQKQDPTQPSQADTLPSVDVVRHGIGE